MHTPSTSIRERLHHEQQQLQAMGRKRQLAIATALDFTSNDYLGLSRHPEVIQAMEKAAQTYGAGAPGSRLLGGHSLIHEQVERQVAHWCDAEAALLLSSGWHANIAVLGALARPDDLILSDALNHASLIDACRLTRARTTIFRHRDLHQLEQRLRQTPCHGVRFILTESVYSMDGDLAPLEDYLRLAHTYDAYLIVDEAHAVGLWGPSGQGRMAELPPDERLIARTLTAGKSLGVSGSFIVGDTSVITAVVNHSRSFIYTTAVSPGVAGALGRSVHILQSNPHISAPVFDRAAQLRRELKERWSVTEPILGEAAIVPIVLGSETRALAVASDLQKDGFSVLAVRPPTVPAGTSRIRVVCHANHSEADISALAEAIYRAIRNHPAQPTGTRPPTPRGYTVIGTDTEVGKTGVSALLTRYFLRKGPTRYLKPVQTGDDSDTNTVAQLAEVPKSQIVPPPVQFPLPASIDQAAEDANTEVHLPVLLDTVRKLLQQTADATWVVETAGGLLVPINRTIDQSHLVQKLRFPVVLVARSGLGTLNHTFLTIEAAEKRRLPIAGVILVGPHHEANMQTFTRRRPDLKWLSLPRFAPLNAQALAEWLDEGGEALLDGWFS